MEEKKTNNSKIIIILLIVIILALVGAVVYLVMQNNQLKNQNEEQSNEIETLETQVDEKENTINSIRNILSDTIDEIDKDNTTSNTNNSTNTASDNNHSLKQLYSAYSSIIKSIEDQKSGEYQYKLAYVNDDDLPELIIDKNSYYTSIISPIGNKLFIIKNESGDPSNNEIVNNKINSLDALTLLPYGTSHRMGYNYIEKSSTIISTMNSTEEVITEIYKVDGDKVKLETTLTSNLNDGTYFMNNASIDKAQYDKKIQEINNSKSLEEDMKNGQATIDYLATLQ